MKDISGIACIVLLHKNKLKISHGHKVTISDTIYQIIEEEKS